MIAYFLTGAVIAVYIRRWYTDKDEWLCAVAPVVLFWGALVFALAAVACYDWLRARPYRGK